VRCPRRISESERASIFFRAFHFVRFEVRVPRYRSSVFNLIGWRCLNREEFCHDRTTRKNARRTALRSYSRNTIEVYIRCVANFAQHFRGSPDRLGPEHIRQYQLFLVERKKVSSAVLTKRYARYVFSITTLCSETWMIEHIPYPRHEQKLPIVLSPSEVAAVFEATRNLKHRVILMTIYGAGLRVSELTNLQVTDRQPTPGHLCPLGQGPQSTDSNCRQKSAVNTGVKIHQGAGAKIPRARSCSMCPPNVLGSGGDCPILPG
jgi:integrase